MTSVEVRCGTCAHVSTVTVAAVLLEVSAEDREQQLGGAMNWLCDGCSDLVRQLIDWPSVLTLVDAGTPVVDPQAHLTPHPEFPPDGPRLGHDELLDLHEALADPDWFSTVMAMTPGDGVHRLR